MSRSLADQLSDLRRELRLAVALRGAIWTIVALVLSLLVVIGLDFLVQSDAVWWRWTMTGLCLAPAIVTCALFVVRPILANFDPLELAQRLERADPSWRGELASAAAFTAKLPSLGSPSLQQKTLDQATRRFAASPVRLVQWSRVGRAGLMGIGVLFVAGIVVFFVPDVTRTALSRVSRPWAAAPWPRRVELRLVLESGATLPSPLRISQAEPFRFFVKNLRGSLPDDVTLQIDRARTPLQQREIPTADQAPASVGQGSVGVATLLASEGPFRFRVIGGDDQGMAFRTVHVVAPPRLRDFVVTVEPPDYLNAEPTIGPPGATRVRGVVGSHVTIKATANKPLVEAALFVGDQPAPDPEILEGGRTILASFKLTNGRPSSYWFRLRDRSGFENRRPPRYEIAAKIDAAPEVSLIEPKRDVTATSRAILPIAVKAGDDHGLTLVRLRFGSGSHLPDAQSADSQGATETIPLMASSERPTSFARRVEWALDGLDLEIGDRVTIRAEANDAFNLGPPRVGVSAPRTIAIVSAETKRRELLASQAILLRELSEAHGAVVELRQAAGALAVEVAASETLQPSHHERISRSELKFQRIQSDLVEAEGSSEMATRKILAELTTNQIDAEALQERLEHIVGTLSSLSGGALPATARHLTAARKSSQAKEVAQALQAAGDDLAVVEQALADVVEQLGAWQRRRDLLAEIKELAGTQRSLIDETASVAEETLGHRAEQLTPAQLGHLEALALRQTNLSDRINRLSHPPPSAISPKAATSKDQDGALSSPGEKSTDAQTPRAERAATRHRRMKMKNVREGLESSGMAMTARAAGKAIRKNRLGQAQGLQSEIITHLQRLADVLETSSRSSARASSLQQLRKELAGLSTRQQDLLETLVKRGRTDSTPTAQQRRDFQANQERLRTHTSQAAQQAQRSSANEAGAALAQAGAAMKQALERLRKQDDHQAREDLAQALRKLNQARKLLASKGDTRENPLAEAMTESLAAQFQTFAKRQASVNGELDRLHHIKSENGTLTRAQLLTLRGTADVQSQLASEVSQARADLADAIVIQFTLAGALAGMKDIAESLEDRNVGLATRRRARRVLQRLQEIVKAFEAASPSANQQRQNGNGNGNGNENGNKDALPGRKAGGVPSLVALELLQLRQLELQRRTRDIERQRQDDSSDSDLNIAAEVEAIAQETAAIAELAAKLLSQQSPTE